jgi:cyclase
MNRRDFLRHSSLLAAAGLFARPRLFGQSSPAMAAKAAAATTFGSFTTLRGDVGTFVGRGGTIGWWSGKDGVVVVDTQFPDTAAFCLAGLPGRSGRKIDVVLNTHHHADHTSGNPVFRPAAKTIVAQANVPKLQFAAAERAERDPKSLSWARLDQQVYADTTFAEAWRHDAGSEIITAQYFGAAHTSGDAVIMFEKANVVHMGDLVFNRLYPVIDRVSGGTVRGWISVLEKAVKALPTDAIYIFGHGSSKFGVTGKHGDLLVMRDYWTAVLGRVEKDIAAGKSREEIVALANLPGFDDFHTPAPNRLSSNLAAAFEELTEKKG